MFRTIARASAAIFFSAALFAPLGVSAALSAGQVQSVVTMLQAFGVDQATITNVSAALTGSTTSNPSSASCVSLSYNLYAGQTDSSASGQVTELQQFLGVSPTGYFGPLTEQAVQQYQSNHHIVTSGSPDTTGYGFVGPQTRDAMSCGGSSNVAYGNTNIPYAPTSTTNNTNTTPTIVFNQSSLTSASPNPIITGTAQGVSQIRIDIYGHTSILATAANGVWQAPVTESLGYGVYSVQAVDLSSSRILASSALVIKSTVTAITSTTQPAVTTVPVSTVPGSVATVPGGATSASKGAVSINASSLIASGGMLTVSGTATGITSVLAYLLPTYYTGARDFDSISASAAKSGSASLTVIAPRPNPAPVQTWNNMWFAYFGTTAPTGSTVAIFDPTTHALLAYGFVNGNVFSASGGGENNAAGDAGAGDVGGAGSSGSGNGNGANDNSGGGDPGGAASEAGF